MVNLDYYASMGFALELLAQSPYHKKHEVGNYFHSEILPALRMNQVRFYMTEEGIPTAMVIWAWLNESVQQQVHTTGRVLKYEEWNCGDRLFFNDFVAPYENCKAVINDLKTNIFPDHIATSLRRNPDGSIRRINRWIGVNTKYPKIN